MSSRPVRVRFAPSPTGPLHMGGIRTALYNYLFAKKNNGDFILRIEDTDQNRYVEGAEEYIINALKWCNLEIDEGPGLNESKGPFRQSERKPIYKKYVDQLVESGNAYYAFDTSEELEKMRELAKKAKMPNWQYNTITRNSMKNSLSLSKEEIENRFAKNEPCAIRIKMPRDEDVRFHDEIRGWVVVNTNNIDDKVLFKSDGMPTYHLANIIDDHAMEISHVIRGEEWLPSAPLHVMLYEAFGWDTPKFAHLPLLLKPDGNGKLSKRDGDRLGFPVFPTNWTTAEGDVFSGYRENGYFPEAFVNMLAFLGWNPGTTQEIFSLEDLNSAFSLERVSKAGAKFDPDKTRWFQQQYLRATDDSVLAEELSLFLGNKYPVNSLITVCALVKERATFIEDIWTEGSFLMERPVEFDEKTIRKKWKGNAAELMNAWSNKLTGASSFSTESIELLFKAFLTEKELGIGAVLPLFRLLLTGRGMGPNMFDVSAFLGKDECVERLRAGLAKMAELNTGE